MKLKSYLGFSLAVMLMGFGWNATAKEVKLEPAKKFVIRDGLPNVAKKLQDGKDVSVVFIGGSITVGGGAPYGYVTKVTNWLKENYPKANIKVHNAGISGTDSRFGARRYDRDVLQFKPDLVFIEFCVNDGDRDHTQHMERIVHKTWLSNPETDIAIFYTLAQKHLASYKKGMLPPSASAHERVADFYGIPTVGTGYEVARKVNNNEMDWKDFSRDGCHPHQKGHGFFAQTFKETLPELLKAGKAGPHKLGKSITKHLQVYPPKIKTEPQKIKPFVSSKGEKASRSFALPIPRINWKGEPTFEDKDGKTIWRLHYQKRNKKTTPEVGLDKQAWSGNNMMWFEEGRCFYAPPKGTALFGSHGKDASLINFGGKQLAVLTFVAPETGRYIFHVKGGKIGAWKSEDKIFGLNMAVFRWGKEKGENLKSKTATKKDFDGIDWEVEVKLTAGEEVIFIPLSNASGSIRGGIRKFNVHIGLMPKK